MAAQIEQLDIRDVEGYLDFLSYTLPASTASPARSLSTTAPDAAHLPGVPPADMLKVDPWLTMDQAIRRRVHSPHLRQLLGRFATYVGASPYLAPATLSVIAHVELTGGVWYPRGGIYAIADAMHRLAVELGVKIYLNSPVPQIETSPGKSPAGSPACSCADGRHVPVEHRAGQRRRDHRLHALARSHPAPRRLQQLQRTDTSCSGFVLLLGVEGEHAQLAHHNIFFNADYRARIRRYLRPRPCARRIPRSTWRSPPRATSPTRRRAARTGSSSSTPPPWARSLTGQAQAHSYRDLVFATLVPLWPRHPPQGAQRSHAHAARH